MNWLNVNNAFFTDNRIFKTWREKEIKTQIYHDFTIQGQTRPSQAPSVDNDDSENEEISPSWSLLIGQLFLAREMFGQKSKSS